VDPRRAAPAGGQPFCRWLPHRDNGLSQALIAIVRYECLTLEGVNHVCLGPDLIAYLIAFI
jgi:hypothetical protein